MSRELASVLAQLVLVQLVQLVQTEQQTSCEAWQPCLGVEVIGLNAQALDISVFGQYSLSRSETARRKSPVYIKKRQHGNRLFL